MSEVSRVNGRTKYIVLPLLLLFCIISAGGDCGGDDGDGIGGVGECARNSDCPSVLPFCVNNDCVECLEDINNTGCPNEGQFLCVDGECVECEDNTDCPNNFFCNPNGFCVPLPTPTPTPGPSPSPGPSPTPTVTPCNPDNLPSDQCDQGTCPTGLICDTLEGPGCGCFPTPSPTPNP